MRIKISPTSIPGLTPARVELSRPGKVVALHLGENVARELGTDDPKKVGTVWGLHFDKEEPPPAGKVVCLEVCVTAKDLREELRREARITLVKAEAETPEAEPPETEERGPESAA